MVMNGRISEESVLAWQGLRVEDTQEIFQERFSTHNSISLWFNT